MMDSREKRGVKRGAQKADRGKRDPSLKVVATTYRSE